MGKVLYVDSRRGRRSESSQVASIEDLDLRITHGIGEAEAILEQSSSKLEAVLFAWDPRDGIEPIERLLTSVRPTDLEVVAVVARRHAGNAESAIAAGAFWVVTVPCDALHLRRVLKAAADTTELRRGMVQADRDCERVLDLLAEAEFHFQTPQEARLLAERLGSRCPEPQATVALLELMVNAVEHGNLGIDYQEKGALLADGLFEQEVERRLEAPEYRDLFASLKMLRCDGCLKLLLSDAGPGFDWSRFLVFEEDRLLDSHGRGILLANATLDVTYLPPGNRVKIRMPLAGASDIELR